MNSLNIYRHRFNVRCPNNDAVIAMELEIQSPYVIMVETIVEACAQLERDYHEDVADTLAERFPNALQILRAHHHGVDIETRRGEL